jgi:shikimate kinase
LIKFSEIIEEGVHDPAIFKAIFLAGGPGSGKTFVTGKTSLTALGLKLINSDTAFENALKKAGLEMTPADIYSDEGQEIRGRAVALTNKKLRLALDGRLGLVIDGTGKDYNKIEGQKRLLEKQGYETMMLFVNTNLDTALQRNSKRPRVLPPSKVKDMWQGAQNNIGKYQNLFHGNLIIIDNSEDSNIQGAVLNAYKKIRNWIQQKPKNSVAQKWIKIHTAK